MIATVTGSRANGTDHRYGINSADTAMKAHFKTVRVEKKHRQARPSRLDCQQIWGD
jgi:hypothetical protein